ncbi:MAG: glycosyltransferase family A protein [Minwuia sp.]|nr:glycosyltransferase family A protein [Minwuia sp.]
MPSLVSILTPSFNREDLVAETLDSVLAQTWPHWEMLVVDDGSTDRTKEIVAEYAARDSRIRLYDRTWQPKGACTCRNEGVAMCDGDYVMFLDTDDIIEPFCLENRVRAMDGEPDLDFAIFPGLMFEHAPHDLGLWWNIDKAEDELTRQFRQDAIAQGTGVLWRKESFVRIGMWDLDLMLWQDIELFFRAYIQGYRYRKFFDLPPDLHNRVNPASLSRSQFFAPAKQWSRVQVVKQTAALLRANGQTNRLPELRFMVVEIATGASRSGQMRLATSLLHWALREGVVQPGEALRIAVVLGLHQSRLTRFGPAQRLVSALLSSFSCQSTIGQIPITTPVTSEVRTNP